MSVLEELEGVVRAIERALDVAEHDVYPASAVGFGGLATAAGIDHGVGMIERNHGTEGAQTVTEDLGLRVQASLRPLGQGVQREGGDRLDNRTPGTTGGVRFYRDPKKGTDVTNGRLFSEPRPALPPLRSPPRYASSIWTKPVNWRAVSRIVIACMILCFKRHAVRECTPRCRDSSSPETLVLV